MNKIEIVLHDYLNCFGSDYGHLFWVSSQLSSILSNQVCSMKFGKEELALTIFNFISFSSVTNIHFLITTSFTFYFN